MAKFGVRVVGFCFCFFFFKVKLSGGQDVVKELHTPLGGVNWRTQRERHTGHRYQHHPTRCTHPTVLIPRLPLKGVITDRDLQTREQACPSLHLLEDNVRNLTRCLNIQLWEFHRSIMVCAHDGMEEKH